VLKLCWLHRALLVLINHNCINVGRKIGQTEGRTDRHQTVALHFPLQMWPALSGLFYFVWRVCACNCSCRMHCWRHVSTLTSLMSSKWVALVIWRAVLSFFYLATVCCWHLLPSWSNINVFSVSRLTQKEIGNFSARAELCNSKFCLYGILYLVLWNKMQNRMLAFVMSTCSLYAVLPMVLWQLHFVRVW